MSVHVVELGRNASGQWEMCYPQCLGPGSYPDIVLDENSGGHTIVFQIRTMDPQVTFAPTVQDAIWIRPGSKPGNPVIAPAGQLGTPMLVNDNRTLILNDKNKGQGIDLHYQLNFSDGSRIDPVIRNGGGEGFFDVMYVIVALVVLALVGFAGYRIGARSLSER